jgi:hypothetical protein
MTKMGRCGGDEIEVKIGSDVDVFMKYAIQDRDLRVEH